MRGRRAQRTFCTGDLRGITAVKTLEDVLDLRGRDADPLVSDLDHHIACKLSDADRDGGT